MEVGSALLMMAGALMLGLGAVGAALGAALVLSAAVA